MREWHGFAGPIKAMDTDKESLYICAKHLNDVKGTLPEWLTGSPAKRLCIARVSSNLTGVVFFTVPGVLSTGSRCWRADV